MPHLVAKVFKLAASDGMTQWFKSLNLVRPPSMNRSYADIDAQYEAENAVLWDLDL